MSSATTNHCMRIIIAQSRYTSFMCCQTHSRYWHISTAVQSYLCISHKIWSAFVIFQIDDLNNNNEKRAEIAEWFPASTRKSKRVKVKYRILTIIIIIKSVNPFLRSACAYTLAGRKKKSVLENRINPVNKNVKPMLQRHLESKVCRTRKLVFCLIFFSSFVWSFDSEKVKLSS